MTKTGYLCFILSICWFFLLADIAVSGENKIEQQRAPLNKTTFTKVRKNKSLPRIDERYSMMIIGPNCHSGPIDPGIIVKKKYDPNTHPELRIIDPYTKKEITRNIGPCFGFI